MLGKAPLVYEAGSWQIDTARRELRTRGAPVPLGSRTFEIVEVLVQAAGELVTKDEIMAQVWPGAIVGENTLQVHVSAIRKALGPDRAMLKTASGRGYRLLGDWVPLSHPSTPPPVAFKQARVSESATTNFPGIATDLIGRSNASQLLSDLASAYRVVTLTGPGGIGKTALAVETARCLLADFEDGGWLVELASSSDPNLVPSAVAESLGLNLGVEAGSPENVARAIGGRKLLLVLDNCEHLLEAAAQLTRAIVRQCPNTTVLATSRELLGIEGEIVYRVPPLEVPTSDREIPDRLRRYSAVELFITRMRTLDGDFSPSDTNLPEITAICRHLDGIPLAIEFAAARAATLGIEQVAAGLHNRFALLTSGRRTALPRHRTLRATLDWSYQLLTEAEQLLLRRLAIFPAGFTLDAAAAVVPSSGRDAFALMDGISNLVSKSLVVLNKSEATSRWYMLETIRVYALEKLVEHAEADIAAKHHAGYFRDLFTPLASGARSSLSDEDLARCVREIDNVRAALDWSFSSAGDRSIGVDITAAYAPVWRHLSLMSECRERCERALLSLEPHVTTNMRLRMELQMAIAAAIFITMGPAEQARTLLIEALETADALNDLDAQVRALSTLMSIYTSRGEHGRERIALERIEQIATRIGDPASLRLVYRQMGTRLLTSGRPREAQQYLERVLRSPASQRGRHGLIYYNSNDHAAARALLARALWMQGFTEQALHEVHLSLKELQGPDHQLLLCRTLYVGICRITPMIGDFATADREIARLIEVATDLNAHFWLTAGHFLKGKMLVEHGQFAQGLLVLRDAFETCGRTGWTMSYSEFKGALASGLAGIGRLDEALGALEDAVAKAGQGADGQVWYVPELLRIKGEVLLQQAADQSALAAEDCFKQAAQMAREQSALFWELRIALSVARLRVSQGRHHDARAPLASVYDRFTEGFATADLEAARALLDKLSL